MNLKRLYLVSDYNIGFSQLVDEAAMALSMAMAELKIGLVYRKEEGNLIGGIAETINSKGGSVTCILLQSTEGLKRKQENIEHIEVHSYDEAKMRAFEISDGFVVFPGGIGTMEIMLEYLTWMQRVYQPKPVIVLNLGDYWKHLFMMFEKMKNELFLPMNFHDRYLLFEEIQPAILAIRNHLFKERDG